MADVQLNDLKAAALTAAGFTGSVQDMELAWLHHWGALGDALQDAWVDFLTNIYGIATDYNALNDALFAWLGDLGYTASDALNDRLVAFWTAGSTPLPASCVYFFPLKSSLAPNIGATNLSLVRAGSATYIDPADGLLKTVGNNVARFERDGLLLESAATNELLYSNDFSSAAWMEIGSFTGSVLTQDAISPDGTANAWRVTVGTLLGADRTTCGFAQFLGVNYTTGSVWVRNRSVTAQGAGFICVNFGVGGHQASIELSATNEWVRIGATGAANGAFVVALYSPLDNLIEGEEFDIAFAQAENDDTSPSSYIPTTVAAVTRVRDYATHAFGSYPNYEAAQTLSAIAKYRRIDATEANNRLCTISPFRQINVAADGTAKAVYGSGTASSAAGAVAVDTPVRLATIADANVLSGGDGKFNVASARVKSADGTKQVTTGATTLITLNPIYNANLHLRALAAFNVERAR